MSVIDGPKYILHWDSKIISEVFNLQKTYEISYWETGKPLEVRGNRLLHTANRLCFCLPSYNFIFPLLLFFPSSQAQVENTTNQEFTFTSKFLELGKNYIAKVRTIVSDPDYKGYWSEWSEEFGWQTTNGKLRVHTNLLLDFIGK